MSNLCGENCGWCGACTDECPDCGRVHPPPQCSEVDWCSVCGEWPDDCTCSGYRYIDTEERPSVTLPDGESRG